MVVCCNQTPGVKIVVNGQVLEQVMKFKYLGQWITDDGGGIYEIKNHIEIARSTFLKMRDVLTTWKLHLGQKTSGKVLCTFHLFVCHRIMDTK